MCQVFPYCEREVTINENSQTTESWGSSWNAKIFSFYITDSFWTTNCFFPV